QPLNDRRLRTGRRTLPGKVRDLAQILQRLLDQELPPHDSETLEQRLPLSAFQTNAGRKIFVQWDLPVQPAENDPVIFQPFSFLLSRRKPVPKRAAHSLMLQVMEGGSSGDADPGK